MEEKKYVMLERRFYNSFNRNEKAMDSIQTDKKKIRLDRERPLKISAADKKKIKRSKIDNVYAGPLKCSKTETDWHI